MKWKKLNCIIFISILLLSSFVVVFNNVNAKVSGVSTSDSGIVKPLDTLNKAWKTTSDFDSGIKSGTSTSTDDYNCTNNILKLSQPIYKKGINYNLIYHLNEGSGSIAIDSSGNSNDGSINSCPYEIGKYGYGLDTSSGYLTSSLTDYPYFTFSAYLYLNDNTGYSFPFYTGIATGWFVEGEVGGGLFFYVGGGTGLGVLTTVPLHQWTQIVIKGTPTTWTVYKNGVNISYSTGLHRDYGSNYIFGSYLAYNWKGLEDEIYITHNLLTDSQINYSYNYGKEYVSSGTWEDTATKTSGQLWNNVNCTVLNSSSAYKVRCHILDAATNNEMSYSDWITSDGYQSFTGWNRSLNSIDDNTIKVQIEYSGDGLSTCILDGNQATDALSICTKPKPPSTQLYNDVHFLSGHPIKNGNYSDDYVYLECTGTGLALNPNILDVNYFLYYYVNHTSVHFFNDSFMNPYNTHWQSNYNLSLPHANHSQIVHVWVKVICEGFNYEFGSSPNFSINNNLSIQIFNPIHNQNYTYGPGWANKINITWNVTFGFNPFVSNYSYNSTLFFSLDNISWHKLTDNLTFNVSIGQLNTTQFYVWNITNTPNNTFDAHILIISWDLTLNNISSETGNFTIFNKTMPPIIIPPPSPKDITINLIQAGKFPYSSKLMFEYIEDSIYIEVQVICQDSITQVILSFKFNNISKSVYMHLNYGDIIAGFWDVSIPSLGKAGLLTFNITAISSKSIVYITRNYTMPIKNALTLETFFASIYYFISIFGLLLVLIAILVNGSGHKRKALALILSGLGVLMLLYAFWYCIGYIELL